MEILLEITEFNGNRKIMRANCPLCDTSVPKIQFSLREFAYKKCTACGALFVANELSSLDLADHYSKSYYEADSSNDQDRKGYPSYRQAQKTLTESFKQKLQVVRKNVSGGRLLD